MVDVKQAYQNEMCFTKIKTSTYGNAHFESDNATVSQVCLNLIKVTKFIYMKVIKCMQSTKIETCFIYIRQFVFVPQGKFGVFFLPVLILIKLIIRVHASHDQK